LLSQPSCYLLTYLHSFPTRRSSDLLAGSDYLRDGRSFPARGQSRPPLETIRKNNRQTRFQNCRLRLRNVVRNSEELRRRSRQFRSEEHTSELQSLRHLVCRLLLEKK